MKFELGRLCDTKVNPLWVVKLLGIMATIQYSSEVINTVYADDQVPTGNVNSLAPERCVNYFKSVISEHMLQIKFMRTSYEIALLRMPQETFDEMSILVLGNSLVPSDNAPLTWWHQAIAWVHADPDLCSQMAPQGHELTMWAKGQMACVMEIQTTGLTHAKLVSLTSPCCCGWPAPMNTPQGQQRELSRDGCADFSAWLESDLVLIINFN